MRTTMCWKSVCIQRHKVENVVINNSKCQRLTSTGHWWLDGAEQLWECAVCCRQQQVWWGCVVKRQTEVSLHLKVKLGALRCANTHGTKRACLQLRRCKSLHSLLVPWNRDSLAGSEWIHASSSSVSIVMSDVVDVFFSGKYFSAIWIWNGLELQWPCFYNCGCFLETGIW